jgi:hypothetical protein
LEKKSSMLMNCSKPFVSPERWANASQERWVISKFLFDNNEFVELDKKHDS